MPILVEMYKRRDESSPLVSVVKRMITGQAVQKAGCVFVNGRIFQNVSNGDMLPTYCGFQKSNAPYTRRADWIIARGKILYQSIMNKENFVRSDGRDSHFVSASPPESLSARLRHRHSDAAILYHLPDGT